MKVNFNKPLKTFKGEDMKDEFGHQRQGIPIDKEMLQQDIDRRRFRADLRPFKRVRPWR